MDPRKAFEQWYAENAFDYESAPIGSRDCDLQWRAWVAGMMYQDKAKALEDRVAMMGLEAVSMTPSDITSALNLHGNLHKGLKKE
jgi:hypothetical protein